MATRVFSAVLHKEDPLWVAECPEAGTVSQGETMEGAVANLKEAGAVATWYCGEVMLDV
jgi:predicted RNase H-like HicB family nuclease